MGVSLFGLAAALLSGTVLVLLLHLFGKPLRRTMGNSWLLALYLLCAARMVFPVKFAVSPLPAVSLERYFPQEDTSRWLYGISFLWGCPAVVLLVVFWVRYLRGVQRLSKLGRSCPVAEDVLERIQANHSRPWKIQVLVCPEVKIPLGVGLFRRRIVLPQEDYSREERFYILQHEYIHFRKGDLWIKFLVCIFCCVFWWNPAARLLQKDVSQLLELRCDQAVTRGLEDKSAYLSVLLDAVKRASGEERSVLPPVRISLFSRAGGRQMIERFQAVMSQPETNKSWRKGAAFTLMLGAVAASLFLVGSAEGTGLKQVTAVLSGNPGAESIWRFDSPKGILQLPEQQAREWLESQGLYIETETRG